MSFMVSLLHLKVSSTLFLTRSLFMSMPEVTMLWHSLLSWASVKMSLTERKENRRVEMDDWNRKGMGYLGDRVDRGILVLSRTEW